MKLNVKDGNEANSKNITAGFNLGTDQKLIKKANLGKVKQTCKVCGASGSFQTWRGREMFIGLRDEFNYFECPACGCLQIEKFPENIGEYYDNAYYSFQQPEIKPPNPGVRADTRMILDVGCGAGSWLCFLATIGCVNLYGCDPFIDEDIYYSNGVKIKKCTVHEMEGTYDVIHLSHSFEHMPDPREVFESFGRLLKHGRGEYNEPPKIEITIPIFPNAAFEIYGPYWYQMDPPRHYFLHSVKSMKMLAEETGFVIKDITYQGSEGQYYISQMYQMGVTFRESGYKINNDPAFSGLKSQLPLLKALSQYSIAAECSDQAMFTLVRK